MRVEGKAVCLPADVDTDQIIAGRYLRTKDHSIWACHVFEDLDPSLSARLTGTIIVAGKNFGCGSSREQAVIALKEAGVRAVISPEFARIFFRNAINIGLPVAECQCTCREGTEILLEPEAGFVEYAGKRYSIHPLSPRMLSILKAGGLVGYREGLR